MNVKAVGHGNLYRVETEKEVRNMIFLVEPQTKFLNMGPSGPCPEYGGGDPDCCDNGDCRCPSVV